MTEILRRRRVINREVDKKQEKNKGKSIGCVTKQRWRVFSDLKKGRRKGLRDLRKKGNLLNGMR